MLEFSTGNMKEMCEGAVDLKRFFKMLAEVLSCLYVGSVRVVMNSKPEYGGEYGMKNEYMECNLAGICLERS